MKIVSILIVLSLLVFVVGCQSNNRNDENLDLSSESNYVSDEIIVDEVVDSVVADIVDDNVEEDYVEIGEMI